MIAVLLLCCANLISTLPLLPFYPPDSFHLSFTPILWHVQQRDGCWPANVKQSLLLPLLPHCSTATSLSSVAARRSSSQSKTYPIEPTHTGVRERGVAAKEKGGAPTWTNLGKHQVVNVTSAVGIVQLYNIITLLNSNGGTKYRIFLLSFLHCSKKDEKLTFVFLLSNS